MFTVTTITHYNARLEKYQTNSNVYINDMIVQRTSKISQFSFILFFKNVFLKLQVTGNNY